MHAKGGQLNLNRLIPSVPLFCLRSLRPGIPCAAAAENRTFTVKYLFIPAVERHADLIVVMLYRCKVAYHQKSLFRLTCLSYEGDYIVLAAGAVNPLESFRIIIHLIKSRTALIQMI